MFPTQLMSEDHCFHVECVVTTVMSVAEREGVGWGGVGWGGLSVLR